jgi:hypothetical protein
LPHGLSGSTAERRETIQEGVQGNSRFRASQRRAEAIIVNARAERDMVPEIAIKPKLVWIGKSLRVAIRRGEIRCTVPGSACVTPTGTPTHPATSRSGARIVHSEPIETAWGEKI